MPRFMNISRRRCHSAVSVFWGKLHDKLRELAFFVFHFDLPAMLLHDEVAAYGRRLIDKPKSVPCPVGFVVKKGLKILPAI